MILIEGVNFLSHWFFSRLLYENTIVRKIEVLGFTYLQHGKVFEAMIERKKKVFSTIGCLFNECLLLKKYFSFSIIFVLNQRYRSTSKYIFLIFRWWLSTNYFWIPRNFDIFWIHIISMDLNHRLDDRCVLRHISNMNFLSWAVLGSRGYKEKRIQTAISLQLLTPVFYVFMGKKNLNLKKYIY